MLYVLVKYARVSVNTHSKILDILLTLSAVLATVILS